MHETPSAELKVLPFQLFTLSIFNGTFMTFKRLALFIIGLSCINAAMAENTQIAVATNFAIPMQKIASQFQLETGHRVIISSGSTGKFYTQIKNGAPFDVFLSADATTAERLEREHEIVSGSRYTYAIGKLALWSPQANFVDQKGQALITGRYDHIAIANPKAAPYGMAAQQTMQKLNLWWNLQSKLVQGENIGQTHQFVKTGNVELGFVALSQIQVAGKISGSYWLVPQHFYNPLIQQAVLLNTGQNNPAAKAFMAFLKSTNIQNVIKSYGYGIAN